MLVAEYQHQVLFVCLGNICRSPLAQGVFESVWRDALEDHGADSAGTAAYHVGKAPDSRAIRVGKELGIDISQQKARQIQWDDFSLFDQIYVMDDANLQSVIALAPDGTSNVKKVMSLLPSSSSDYGIDVPDPYYGDISDFQHVVDLLHQAANNWLRLYAKVN
jgi:protein-tyrosine phosphatase